MVDELLREKNSETGGGKSEMMDKSSLHRFELSLDVSDILELDLSDDAPLKTNDKLEKIKCFPSLGGGGDASPGFSRLATPRNCSALHCRDCDLPVRRFPDHEWTETVEYLFLRTNMPNFEKVSTKLRRKVGTTAYACHCVSFSTEKRRPLHELNLPWFCKGHF